MGIDLCLHNVMVNLTWSVIVFNLFYNGFHPLTERFNSYSSMCSSCQTVRQVGYQPEGRHTMILYNSHLNPMGGHQSTGTVSLDSTDTW